jgi:Tfp pilus assembly protein PilN
MKAVNLIPADQRRGSRGGSGFGAYAALIVLAVVVAMSASYALANRSLTRQHSELASVQSQVQTAQSRAGELASYTGFSALRQKREDTVRSLAASRFDWSHALHEIARTIPSDAWLSSLRGTVAPGTAVDGGSTDPLRASEPGPAIEMVGCTTSQAKVASLISSLRRVDGVQRVTLSSSERNDPAKGASGSATASGSSGEGADCRYGNAHYPQFSLTLFFDTPSASDGQTPAQGKTP